MKQELSNNKYLSKRLKLEEIKNPQQFFKLLTESNLIKFLIRLFFNKENFSKLFDFRIISSLILRDLYSSKTHKSSLLKSFLLIILSLIFYRLNNKVIIEKKYLNLVKIVYGHINYFKYKKKKLKKKFNKKNIFTSTNYSLSKILELKKKNYFKPFTYNKNLIEDSEWWKLWILKEIMPNWKISSNSIEKIQNLLKKTHTDDLKYFFEFYMDTIFCQNYDWKKNFTFLFYKTEKKNTKLNFIKNKKVLENTLILQIFLAFCEKLVFEVENSLKLNNLNSIIKLDNNNNFFSIPIFYKKNKNSELFYLLKKSLIQNFKFFSESDPIIVKSYIFIKKKEWFFFKNYVEFFIWQLYKSNLLEYETYLSKIDTKKNKLNIKLFKINSLYDGKKRLKIDKLFSKFSYQVVKSILYKVKNFTKFTTNYDIINQNFRLKKKNKILKKKFQLNLKFFFNILFIDELNMSFSSIKKSKIIFEIVKKQQKNFYRYILKSDKNKFLFLWKIKKNNQKLNSFIFLDYAFKIILKKKYNKNKLLLLINLKSFTNLFYLLWSFIYKCIITDCNKKKKYNKILLFEISYFVKLVNFLTKSNLLVIKYSLFDKKMNVDYNINYQNNQNSILKKNLLITNFFPKFSIYSKFINNYKLISNNFYKISTKILNNLFLISKFFFNNKIYLKNRTKINVNQNLLNCKKKKEKSFYYNTIKKNIYIYWKINQNTFLINKKNKNKKIYYFFVEKQKNLLFLFNKINFINKNNSIIKWSNKINKKSIYIFYKTFLFILHTNFSQISKLFLFSKKNNNNIKKNLKRTNLNKSNLLKQVKFKIYSKLKTKFYFDKIFIIKFFINYLKNKNSQIYKKFFNKIFYFLVYQKQEIYFSFLKISNKNLLNSQFFKIDTLKLVNFLYYSNLNYKKKENFYLKKNKKKNLIYKQLIKNIPIKVEEKKNLSINKFTFFYKKKTKNSNIELQIYKIFLCKNLEQNYKRLFFLQYYNFSKLVNSLVKINPNFYKKKDLNKKSLEKNIYIQKPLKKNTNTNQKTYFENYLLSEVFIQIQNKNNKIISSINKLFIIKIKYNSKKNLINTFLNKNNIKRSCKKKTIVSSLAKNFTKLSLQNKIFKISNFFFKWVFFEKYIAWFFTLKWLKYFQNIFSNLLAELLLNINDQFNYILSTSLQNRKKKLDYLLKILLFNLKDKTFGNSFEIWNLRLLKQLNKQHKNSENEWPWLSLNLINKWNKQYITIISLIIFSYFLFQKYFSTLLGSDYFELWGYFEIIKYLTDSSRGIHLENLIYNNSIQFIKSEILLIHVFHNFKHYLKNAKFYLFIKKKINKLLTNNKGLDLSRRERKLLIQSLITDKSIDQYRAKLIYNNNFLSFQFSNSIVVKEHKLKNYFENLVENYQKSLINYPFSKFHLAENLIFLSFWQKMTSLSIPGQFDTLKLTFYKKPIPLELRLFSSKGILLIGSLETGRSYLIKNIAANSFVPLIKISINKLLYNKPDIITESWINILMESLRRLNLILELAEKLSPCIIWVQNIHELNVNRSTQNVESDPTFLLGIFLKYFQTTLKKKSTNNIIIIGSTHLPKKVDPALISPNRLDRLINIRIFNILQRQKKFLILLHSKKNKYFYLKNTKSFINEFGYRTLGYNARDLAGLINEILLISIAQDQTIIKKKIIRLGVHRHVLGSTYINNKTNFTQNYGMFFYKIGKSIIQNLFLKSFSRNPLYFGNDLWKKKFYYLSKWYLEPSIFESTIKEFTILPHILGCLAGLAARDSWFILENKPDNLISLDKSAENDFYLACGILESLLSEFSWLETFEKKNTNKKKKLNFHFQAKNPLDMIKKGLFSITNQNPNKKLLNMPRNQTILYKKELYQLTSNINWAPKLSRLNFIRTNLFNWINRPNQFEITYNFNLKKKKEKKILKDSQKNYHFFDIIQHNIKEQLPYERILSRIRRRNIQELEFQLEDILLEEQFVILGFSQLFTEYRMESQLCNKPIIFLGGRFLWDPTGLLFQNSHFIFSRHKLFIDEEMLRRLYVTYGARREREKSRSSQKIKQFFLCRGYRRNSINDFSINWWNQLFFIEKNNVETFKRIQGIGVQLKRPEVFTPVYLYQRWLIENPRKNFTRFNVLNNQQRFLKVNNLLFNDSFIYNILLELYQYLLNFFILHHVLLNEMTKILLKKKWFFHNEMEYFINILNKSNF